MSTKYVVVDKGNLRALAGLAASMAADLKAAHTAFNVKSDKIRDSIAAKIHALSDENRKAGTTLYESEFMAAIKQLRKDTEHARTEPMAKIKAIAEAMREGESRITNPIQVATTHGLGTPERADFSREVSGLAPRSMATMVAHGKATGNKTLAAVLILENDKAATKDRTFSSSELASQIFAEDVKDAKFSISAITLAEDTGLALWREMEGTPAKGFEKIASAMRNGGTRLTPGDAPLQKERTGVERIAAGLSQ